MGLYDRDYLQDEYRPPGSYAPRMMVTNLLILNAAVFLLNVFLGRYPGGMDGAGDWRLVDWLSVRPPDLLRPWLWWRLLTYGFVHHPEDIGHIFWNMLGLFIFGRDVELRYGRWEFLRFYLGAVLLGSLLWCLRLLLQDADDAGMTRLLGASGGVTAVILLFVYNFPRRTILLMFVLPVPAWVLGALLILGNVMGLGGESSTAFDVHLVGIAFATGYFWLGWNFEGWSPESLRGRFGWSGFRRRPKLRVHAPSERAEREDEEADRILAKVSRDGLESLSAKERRILEEYSRRMRDKRS